MAYTAFKQTIVDLLSLKNKGSTSAGKDSLDSSGSPLEPVTYPRWKASQKEAYIWEQICNNRYSEWPHETPLSVLPILRLLPPWMKNKARSFMKVSAQRVDDFMPEGRKKIFHTYGGVALVKLEGPSSHDRSQLRSKGGAEDSFSGLFEGASFGLLRLSLAGMPNIVTLPGLALKLFVDERPSVNLFGMHSLSGQFSWNIFENVFSNHLEKPLNPLFLPIAHLFYLVSQNPLTLSCAHAASVLSDGTSLPPEEQRAPLQIFFKPNEALKFSPFPHDYRSDLVSLPKGTRLFDLYGSTTLEKKTLNDVPSSASFIGSIVTKTTFEISRFGDEHVFFKHDLTPSL